MSDQPTNETTTVLKKKVPAVTNEIIDELPIPDPFEDESLNESTSVDTTPVIDDAPVATPVVNTVPTIDEPTSDDNHDDIDEPVIQRPKQFVTLEYTYSDPTNWDSNLDTISLPSNHDKETRRVIENSPNINLNDDQETRKWASVVEDGLEFTTEAEIYVPTLEKDDSDFRQALDHNGTKLVAGQPKFKNNENQKLAGERGVIRIMSYLGLGTLFNTPLWHTGIWVTFKAPTESEIIELNRMLVADKIRFGRSTYSLAYSNLTSYTTDKLVKFALDHVYDTTLKSDDIGPGGLRDIISCQDIPSLLWGFTCTMYPRGFQYNRACINDPVKCNHVIEEKLNLSKLQWTNNNALTDWQKTHMSVRRANSKSLADVTRYKEELTKIQKRRVPVETGYDAELAITLKTPSINEHIDSGHRWVGEIVALVEKTLGVDASENEKNTLIVRHGQASAMRQYAHWVDIIEVDTNSVEDRETIDETLDVLSSDNAIRTSFINAVIEYINHSTISVIGIPTFKCPKCSTQQLPEPPLPRHENIIPLDVHQLFFALATAQISRIITR
jgi:hypothetical protein